jgi:hypothetical protein
MTCERVTNQHRGQAVNLESINPQTPYLNTLPIALLDPLRLIFRNYSHDYESVPLTRKSGLGSALKKGGYASEVQLVITSRR